MKQFERVTLGLLVILTLISMVLPGKITIMLAVISLLALLAGFHHLGAAFKWATGIFLILGIVIAITSGFSINQTAAAINSMDGLIALLIIMQLFNVPIKVGNYQESIVKLMNAKFPTNRRLYVFIMLITFLLSSILSMGTVPIVYSILGPTIKQRVGDDYQHFSSVAISRSFTLGTLWAPGAATIFLISTITKVPLQRLFIPSFLMGVGGLVIAYLMEFRKPIMNQRVSTNTNQSTAKLIWPVSQIVMAIIFLLAIAFTLIHFKIGETMSDVAVAGLLVVACWALLLMGKTDHRHQAQSAMQNYFQNGLLNGGSLAPFFVAIGLFSDAFEHSPISMTIAHAMTPVMTHLSWGALVLIPLLVVLLSIIGIHPLASVTLLGQIMMAIHLPFGTLALALGLNIGSVIAYTMSPFAGIVVIIANILGVNSATVSLRWNGKYCLILFAFSLLFIVAYTLI